MLILTLEEFSGATILSEKGVEVICSVTKICKDILKAFSICTRADNRELFDRAYDLSSYFIKNIATLELIEPVIELERSIIEMAGPHKQFLEERIFSTLSTCTLYCAPEEDTLGRPKLSQDLAEAVLSSEQKRRHMLALRLVAFSEEVFTLNRVRDAFTSKRKSLVLELLDRIEAYYDVQQSEAMYGSALASGKKDLVLAAVEFYENYLHRRNTQPSLEILAILNSLVRKTKSRSVAVAALNLQVSTCVISELDALSKIDAWKERNSDRW